MHDDGKCCSLVGDDPTGGDEKEKQEDGTRCKRRVH